MVLPYFYTENINVKELALDEETSRHVVQVLRMQTDEHLLITDGKGNTAEAIITQANKKRCQVELLNHQFIPRPSHQVTIAISLIKNTSRFDWFLEKATELGTFEIIPLICERTERQKFRFDRMISICKSAMLQSMQSWLPKLHEPVPFLQAIQSPSAGNKLIAHCGEGLKKELRHFVSAPLYSSVIFIGPEGDFTPSEISSASEKQFTAVSMGTNRLRTETAGIYAAVMLS